MRETDLPLFEWRPPAAVIAFPLAHRTAKVRHVARKLLDKHGAAADTYWRQTVSTLAGQMSRSGVSDTAIDVELRAFFNAVQAEMVRLTYRGRRPGGAA